MQTLRLVAYGNSLYLRGITACLAAHGGLTVVPVDPDVPGALQRLCELEPDVIAFELYTGCLAPPLDLLHDRPNMLFVVLDPESEEVLVMSSQRAQPTTAGELVDVLLNTVALAN